MDVTNPSLKKLLAFYKDISLLVHIKATLDWDLNVNLPPLGAKERAQQSTYLANLITQKWLAKEFRILLEQANTEPALTDDENAIVRNINFGGKYYFNVPKKLILQKETVTSESFLIWKKAREENKFKIFLPYLQKIIALDREITDHLGYQENPYDALLNLYEPELTAKECELLFSNVRDELIFLIKKIQKSNNYATTLPFIDGKIQYPKSEQERLARYIMTRMGYNFSAGRMDVSPHPFTTSLGRNDIRLTTAYKDHDFRESFIACIHETGHALYEQGINPNYSGSPLEHGVSLGIHEALSRFWENMVGKNPAFLHFATPLFMSHFPNLASRKTDDIVRAFNLVHPSFIRIEADEVTYTLHIILRFEMENNLINGKLQAKDAADAWRAKSKKYLGNEPKSDADGVLQDIHWTYGAFGYFPAYALGNFYGAQFLHTMKKEIKFDDELAKGNLLPVKNWLDKNVHTYGSKFFPKNLIKKVTGKPLDYRYFIEYLNNKYSMLY